MNNFVDFWVGLGYNGWLFLLLILLFFAHLIMIILRSTVLTTKKRPATVEPEEGVSVIITCSNKAELLKQNLEAFLTQEYPKYEVIVVDECSEDETQDVLSDLQQKYPHLKTTRIFPETKFRRTKKIAINIGVLAAQYDVLLFSEINCKPGSGRWLHAMASYFTPDTLLEDRYMMGVFLSPDTLQLSEALILRRWGEVQRQNLINARNNMTGILKQAYAPVDYMDADMNQRMMLNEYARSVEMKGHVDVGIGVGTQSVDAYKMLRMRRRVKNQKEWLNPNEIDLLKKIYYLKKKEKQDN